eukprot:snap_masked-scaffold_39-processed-gene-2.40-mRNA-1 protein AED:1.00 eAED:1.00 QI:0/0/0/0/1/1/2/0/113
MLMSKGIALNAKMNTITILKIQTTQDVIQEKEDMDINTKTKELLALTKKEMTRVEYLYNIFRHRGQEAFKLTLKYYGYDIKEDEINNFNSKVCEINNATKSIIKKKHTTGFTG